MDTTILWQCEEPVTALDSGITVPPWIDQEIDPATIAAIVQGGCDSGAYMPAVTYHQALATMHEHGDEVFDFIDDHFGLGEVFTLFVDGEWKVQPIRSWSQLACSYVSFAVELWARMTAEDEAFVRKVAARVEEQREDFDRLRGYTDQEAYDHENPPMRDNPMDYER